jgi:hypothetical protein
MDSVHFDGSAPAFVWYVREPGETDFSGVRRYSLREVGGLLEKSAAKRK